MARRGRVVSIGAVMVFVMILGGIIRNDGVSNFRSSLFSSMVEHRTASVLSKLLDANETLASFSNAFNQSDDTQFTPEYHPTNQTFQVVSKDALSTDATTKHIVSFEIVEKVESQDFCSPGYFTNRFGRHGQYRNILFEGLLKLTNFSTTLSFGSLRMLVMGDSVGMQIFELLEVASGAANRTVVDYVLGTKISYGLSGNLGAMRMTGMLLRENENKPLPNERGGGWNQTMIQALLNIPDTGGKPISSFDVMLFRMPHGWLELDEITVSTIKESLELASNMMGVKKVILLTLPFINNVDADSRMGWLEKNREIRDFVNRFEPDKTVPGIDGLVLMDFAQLTNEFIQTNAKYLGYLNDTDSAEMAYLDTRIVGYTKNVRAAAAHVCAGPLVKQGPRLLCHLNAITGDGIHFCPQTYGGRVVAATGCLLQCLYGNNDRNLLGCQKKCNDNFMRLTPVQIGTRQVA